MYCLSDLHFESLNTHIYMVWKIATWKQMNFFSSFSWLVLAELLFCVVAVVALVLLLL